MATLAQIDDAFPSADDPEPQSAVSQNDQMAYAASNPESVQYDSSFFQESTTSDPPKVGSGDSNHSRSPLSGLGFFKGLTGSEKKTKADGQPPKRRGPKPDSKPALTRRQQLNRQAQRTHRERKELYIKALEQEVIRLKELYGTTVRERDAVVHENRRLREILAAHNIHLPSSLAPPDDPTSSGSLSGSYPASSTRGQSPPNGNGSSGQGNGNHVQPPGGGYKLDYGQIGIDFVLALERPCMDHMQHLCVEANESPANISGHALMATHPPSNHLLEHPHEPYPHQMPDLQSGDLLKLLDLSNRLPLDGEITPVMAWTCLLRDERLPYLNAEDFHNIKMDLIAKVRCYGFGAVLEEFEVTDCLDLTIATKMEGQITIKDEDQGLPIANDTTAASATVQAQA